MNRLYLPLIVLLSLSGCVNREATDISVGMFSELERGLGPTVVLFRQALPPGQPRLAEKESRTAAIVREVVGAVPETSLFPEERFTQCLGTKDWPASGDLDMARAAKACGARTVAVICLERYDGDLTVSLLPPYWAVRGGFRYRARLIDADTGALLLEADRGRNVSGYFNALGASDLDAEFRSDLAGLLQAPQPVDLHS